jgi:hypothetical protein
VGLQEEELVPPPPSPPAAAPEAALHRTSGGAAARAASPVMASCGCAAGAAATAPWSGWEPRVAASGEEAPVLAVVAWLREISFCNLGGAGDPPFPADGFGPGSRSRSRRGRFAGRLVGFGSGGRHNVVGELLNGVC